MVYNVREHGAAGNGQALDTPAIQEAVDRVSASGGGMVFVPAGTYKVAGLALRSNVNLHLSHGAVLLGSRDPHDYHAAPRSPGRWPSGIVVRIANAENVAISGYGAIDGGAVEDSWLPEAKQLPFRTRLIRCDDCRMLRFEGVTLRNSDSWTLHLKRCQDVAIRGINIFANPRRINTDGIDPDDCRNVIISDCNIVTGDDCIVAKSTEGHVTENLVVTNCVLQSTCTALKLGTDSGGPIRNVTISNCVVRSSPGGIGLFNKDGGTFENILLSNLVIESDGHLPFFIDMTPRWYREPKIGQVRNVTLENVVFRGGGRFYVEGAATQPVENLTVRNLSWDITGPYRTDIVKHLATGKTEVDPDAENYLTNPHHFLLMHVRGLRMEGMRLNDRRNQPAPDRGLFYLRNVQQARIERPAGPESPAGVEPVVTRNCHDVQWR